MERITRFRVRIMLLIICLILGFYGLRLFKLQITEGNENNVTTFTTLTRVKAARGEILDRNGNVLVGNRASYDLVINSYVLLSSSDCNSYLYQMIEVCSENDYSYEDNFPITMERPFTYTLDQSNSTWRSYFQAYLAEMGIDSDISAPLLVERLRSYYGIPTDWTDELARAVVGLRYELSLRGVVPSLSTYVFMSDASDEARSGLLELNIPGLNVESSVVREYYTTYAAHILGYIGKMSAEQWEYYEPLGYSMDASVGQSGLELAMEEYLHGTDGWRVDKVTADGTVIESYYETEPKAGNNVEITIDLNLQMTAEDSLAARIASLQEEGGDGSDIEGAAAVAMDVKTGEILACASYPTYDLANLGEKWEEILEIPYNALYNRALDAAYPPGSTYKMSMVIASIDSGINSIDRIIRDEGIFTKYADQGYAPTCLVYSSSGTTHGDIDARQALAKSCNYYFYVLGDEISLNAMDTTAKNLGLGESTGVELPENTGHRANRETKKALYGEDTGWYTADKIASAIGQSDNQFTPLQLCVYAATLANRGTRYKATFLSRVVSADYTELVLENSPKVMSTFEISDEAFAAYSEGMYQVNSMWYGTGYKTFSDYPVQVAGKTGTAEWVAGSDNGAYVCYAPYDENNPDAPEIAVSIYGEKAGHGSTMAVVARDILDEYFGTEKASDTLTYENMPS